MSLDNVNAPRLARIRRVLSWILLLLSVGFIIHFFGTHRENLETLLEIEVLPLIVLLTLNFFYLIVHGYCFQLVLEKCYGRKIGFHAWFNIYVLGRFLNLIIPQLGNVYRSVRLKQEHQVTFTRYVSGYFSFAWMGTWVNLAIALAVIAVMSPDLQIGPVSAIYPVLGLVVLFGAGPIVLDAWLSSWRVENRALSWVHEKIAEMLRVSVQNLRDRRYLTKFFMLGLVLLGQVCVAFYFCFAALGVTVDPAAVVLFYVLLQLATFVNLTPGNLGVQEIAFGVLAEQMGIGMGEGMLVSVLLRVTGLIALFAVAIPMGGLGVMRQAGRYRSEAGEP